MPLQERRRAVSALVTVLFSIVILVVPMLAIAIAQSTPSIRLWNPSDFSGGEQTTPLVVSDAKTGTDEEDSIIEDTYRLMSTTQNTPAQAVVEYELAQGDLISTTLGEGTRIGADAWEFNWELDGAMPVADGEYTIRAILYSGTGVTASEVDRDEMDVFVRNGTVAGATESPAADISSVNNGDQVGFYMNPITGSTHTVFTVEYSAGTTYLQVFYTTSDPGDTPEWKSCGGPTAVGTENNAPAGQRMYRCALEEEDQGGLGVTGLGVVANESPADPVRPAGGEYDPNFNAGSDAIRIQPYQQDATTLNIDQATVRADGDPNDCSPRIFVTALDQLGKPIAGIDMDVHARGPSDQLKFEVPGLLTEEQPDVKAPDKGHPATEYGWACGDLFGQDFATTEQGDHNLPGVPDVKHIESSGGTSDIGRFGIGMRSDRDGTTQVTFWVDEDTDDQFCSSEPSVVAAIGWNVPAPAPAGETPALTDCPIPVPPAPDSGSPSPSDTGPSDECTIEGTSGDDEIVGTQGNDIICAGEGNDTIDGRGGDDIIRGEDGDDIIDGGIGDDTIDGGTGNDRAHGGPGNDVIEGFTGIDVLLGDSGDDTLRGAAGVDGLQGGSGSDVIQGGGADDVMDGQGGPDVIKGFNGRDSVSGGGGRDILRGMKNNDDLRGGGGNDKLIGGKGKDRCDGGGGRDKLRQCERG